MYGLPSKRHQPLNSDQIMFSEQPSSFTPRKFRTFRTVFALVLREMSSTYGRSSVGYLWAILEPVAAIILLSLVFSVALRAPGLGTNFSLYYASGLLPYLAFGDISSKVAQSLRFSRPLLAFPAVTYVDPFLARGGLSVLVNLVVAGIVFPVVIVWFDVDVILNVPGILLGYVLAFGFGFGVGVMNGFLFMKFPFWQRVWAVVTRPLFFVSCIFFLFETVPEPYRSILWFNPLVHVTGQVREGIYATYEPSYVSWGYVSGVSLVLVALGLTFLRRYYRDLIYR